MAFWDSKLVESMQYIAVIIHVAHWFEGKVVFWLKFVIGITDKPRDRVWKLVHLVPI